MKDRKRTFSIEMYRRWPLILALATFLFNALIFALEPRLGTGLFVISVFVALVSLILYIYSRSSLTGWLIDFAEHYRDTEAEVLSGMGPALAAIGAEGTFVRGNDSFNELFKSALGRHVQSIFADITPEILSDLTETAIVHSSYAGRRYRIELIPVDGDDIHPSVFAVITDETEQVEYKKAYEGSRAAEGLIYIDNYEEVLASVEEVRRGLLTAFVERRINGYISSYGGVVRQLEKDKYFFFIKEKDLVRMIEDKFSLLELVKSISIGNTQKITISIGIGRGGSEYRDNYQYANAAIELALGRGGDQAVLKDAADIVFFGGKTEAKERHERVKARVKAQALRDLLNNADKLIVMGHKNPDIDCLGAAMGIWRIATTFGKRAWVAMGEPNRSLRPMYERFLAESSYPDDLFISAEAALGKIDSQTVLVVVDVARTALTEAPQLLTRAGDKVVIDHHRRTKDMIEDAALTYIEPYASSACELVTEIVEYMDSDVVITPLEADALYGGIMIDTQNFVNQTGVRTLEAASYLRSKGADVSRLRKLMRDSYNDFRAKADAIDKVEIYREHFALSILDASLADTPTVIGAQAANSLLEIDGIKAAVVATSYGGQVFVSARSIDDVNVQVMMEKIGGGGHMSVAGAQLSSQTPEEALAMIRKVIDEMLEEGDVS